jgi:DNA-binding transcriptional MerR regulator
LSEAAKLCGVKASTLKLLISDDLLPQAIRSPQGHALLPEDSVPTWQECRRLIEQRRDARLQRAAKLLDRVQIEVDAIRNDITEAREYPTQPLGVDLLSSSSYSTHSNQTTLSAILQQFTLARMEVEQYHRALRELVESDRP